MKKIILAAVILVALIACGDPSNGSCHPGDTKAAHGHVEKCGADGKWHV